MATRLARLAGFVALAAALPSAAIEGSFPDQPGVLSADEIQSATRAMQQAAGSEPLPLAASGRREPTHMLAGYALFAGPFRELSSGVTARRQIVCNYMRPTERWQCGNPQEEFRMKANGLEHAFSYQVIQGPGDPQAVVDAVGFMYSPCFQASLAAAGGKPVTPSAESDYISNVVSTGGQLRVLTGPRGDGASYQLEKTERKADGCGFRIAAFHAAQPTRPPEQQPAGEAAKPFIMSEKGASERAEERARMLAQNAPRVLENPLLARRRQLLFELGPLSINRESAVDALVQAGIVTMLLTLWLPRIARRRAGNWAAPAAAVGLSALGIALCKAGGALDAEQLEGYLLLYLPAILVSWMAALGFTVTAVVRTVRGRS